MALGGHLTAVNCPRKGKHGSQEDREKTDKEEENHENSQNTDGELEQALENLDNNQLTLVSVIGRKIVSPEQLEV